MLVFFPLVSGAGIYYGQLGFGDHTPGEIYMYSSVPWAADQSHDIHVAVFPGLQISHMI